MIDWGFEDRLIDRIAAREAIAARLTPRQKRILVRYVRYGETLKEVGVREGVHRERINQIYHRSVRLLRGHLEKASQPQRRARPQQTTRDTPPPGFDKVAFLRHMQGLIVRREVAAREAFQRERRALDDLLERESPTYVSPQPTVYVAPKPVYPAYLKPAHQYVAPPPPPSLAAFQLQEAIAKQAVAELTRRLGPTKEPGMPTLGARNNSVSYHTQAGTMETAIRQLLDSMPHGARLSACLFPTSWPGACAANEFAAVNVMGSDEGCYLRLDVSWSEPVVFYGEPD